MRQIVSLLLVLSVLLTMTGSLQVVPGPQNDETILMTLNVCETGVPLAASQGSTPWILQECIFIEPLFVPIEQEDEEGTLFDSLLVTSLDRPPRRL